MTRTTAFELMLGELADKLSPAAMAQAHAVFAGWAGQRIDIPTRRALQARDAEQAARAALSAGATRPQVIERLKGMGLRRAAAYKLAQRVQEGAGNA